MRACRGGASAVLATVLLTAPSWPGTAAFEVRHVAVISRAPGDDFKGTLEVRRSDGRGRRVAVASDVLWADLGRGGALYAVQDRGKGGALVRTDVGGSRV